MYTSVQLKKNIIVFFNKNALSFVNNLDAVSKLNVWLMFMLATSPRLRFSISVRYGGGQFLASDSTVLQNPRESQRVASHSTCSTSGQICQKATHARQYLPTNWAWFPVFLYLLHKTFDNGFWHRYLLGNYLHGFVEVVIDEAAKLDRPFIWTLVYGWYVLARNQQYVLKLAVVVD